MTLPETFEDTVHVEAQMATPSDVLRDELSGLDGGILVLGAGGKMGPTLARLAKNACPDKQVIAAARFSEPGVREALENFNVETQSVDLLDPAQIDTLAKLPNVIFMAGRKFGSQGAEELTWAMNTHVPALVAQAFRDSRIAALSTGCVYEFASPNAPSDETSPLNPPGEYANSCVGRERMFEYFSKEYGTPGRLIRLNYAIDMRYGVLRDIAEKVLNGTAIDLATGHVNVIWQGEANSQVLRCLAHATSPTSPINISGDVVSVRWLAQEFGKRLGCEPEMIGEEAQKGWVVDASAAKKLFGPHQVSLEQMIDWTADWVGRGLDGLGKPTRYEVRDGAY